MKTIIYMVRHTETVGNVEERLTGRQDYELTKRRRSVSKKVNTKIRKYLI